MSQLNTTVCSWPAHIMAASDQTAVNKPLSDSRVSHTRGQRRSTGANRHNTGSDPGKERSARPLEEVGLARELENSKTSGKGAAGVPGFPCPRGDLRHVTTPLRAWTSSSTKLGQGVEGKGESWTSCSQGLSASH